MSIKDYKNRKRPGGYDDQILRGLLERSPGRRKRGILRRVAGPLVIVCAILAVLVAADHWMNAGKIYGGVEVGTVPLGGKTPAEAREVVQERTTGALKEFEFSGPEGESTFTAEEMGVNFDVSGTVDEAYAVGRRGNVLERVAERAQAAYGTITIPPKVDYESEIAQERVRDLAAKLNREPQRASVAIVGSEVQVDRSSEGYELDFPATMNNVDQAVEDMTGEVAIVGEALEPEITTQEAEAAAEKARKAMGGQLVLNAEGNQWTLSPADVGSALNVEPGDGGIQVSLNRDLMKDRLANVYADLTVESVEAGYKINGNEITVTESQTGKSIEEGKLLGAIESGIFEGQREYQVPVVTAEPELTTAEAEALKPTTQLGNYRTNYAIVEDDGQRAENLRIASNAVDGTLVAPGEVFSMNAHVSGLDYNSTKVIVDGAETKADGGGLCQVTSTLYNAANFAGIDVIERHPHYSQLPYIRPGMDATVWFGGPGTQDDLDMKFKNNTDGYLLLREYVSNDGYIYAEIYGKPNGTQVQMSSRPTYMGADYSKWVTYQTVTKNGEVVYDGELHTDVYYPLVDYKGKTIKPSEVMVPPVRP
ncbi:MAG: peptidoglycan binding domain-containing protein [Actinomycetota bacterium]|nr:peptidoglycan binding domain-containing protein [Actinomycetota bacterium]